MFHSYKINLVLQKDEHSTPSSVTVFKIADFSSEYNLTDEVIFNSFTSFPGITVSAVESINDCMQLSYLASQALGNFASDFGCMINYNVLSTLLTILPFIDEGYTGIIKVTSMN